MHSRRAQFFMMKECTIEENLSFWAQFSKIVRLWRPEVCSVLECLKDKFNTRENDRNVDRKDLQVFIGSVAIMNAI